MRLSVRHHMLHRYKQAAKSVIQALRLTPRNHDGQHVVHWRIDIDVECRLRASQDAFGNIVHGFSADGPLESVSVTAIGEVETFDTRGVVDGAVERFAPDLYVRATSLTQADADAKALAETALAEEGELDKLHALLRAAFNQAACEPGKSQTQGTQSQTQSGATKHAGSEALVHLFIAAARHLGIPTRYVAGYRLPDSGSARQGAHAWAEGHVPGLGWVGFDPANCLCPDDRYVRVAIGLDALGASPMRGAFTGADKHAVKEEVSVTEGRGRGTS
jgi:transglutaminase-like putative cysteine protease